MPSYSDERREAEVAKLPPPAIPQIAEALGGKEVFSEGPRNENDMISQIRAGFPVAAIDALMHRFDLTADELAASLTVSLSSIKRRHNRHRLPAPVSDRLFRLAVIFTYAADSLGTDEQAIRWLRKPNRTLNGDPPLSLLDTSIGADQVKKTLMRIEHGIPS